MLAVLSAPVAQQMGVALLATSPGLVTSPFHFIATGYGLSVAALALHAMHTARLLRGPLLFGAMAHVSLLGLFGIRLATFLHLRSQAESYLARPEMIETKKRMSSVSLSKRLLMWIPVSFMYVAMCAPATYVAQAYVHAAQASPRVGGAMWKTVTTAAGLSGMAAGIMLEAGADLQKTALKAREPARFCSTGVYSWVRHPNYAGEILFWASNFLAAVPAMGQDAGKWAFSGLGLALIVQVMLGATARLAANQESKYAQHKDKKLAREWGEYTARTPGLLIPGVSWPEKSSKK